MASLSDAYAQAAEGATKENPGVVHLASGMYRLAASIEMKPYVKVVGDAKGPTIISGDNMSTAARAAFWSKNLYDSVYVSKPGINKTPVWNDDLTFNEPNPKLSGGLRRTQIPAAFRRIGVPQGRLSDLC